MREYQIRNTADALAYMVDCTLATVSSMACLKSRKKCEFARQISIAQKGINWMKEMHVSDISNRAEEINKNYNGSVEKWTEQWTKEKESLNVE